MALSDYLQPSVQRRGLSGYLSPKAPTGAVDRIEEYGYEVPKESGWSLLGKKFLNTLTGVLDVLRTGEYAVGGILAGKSPITGIREKISPSEVLFKDREEERDFWSWRNLTALATDILLDPVTYLTFGTGGAMKLATRGGMVPLTKVGQKVMRQMVARGASEAAARRAMAKVIQIGGEKAAKKYIAKSGLKFMGQVFIPASKFEIVGKAIGKLPGAGVANKVGSGFARAFIPFREIDKLPARLGGKGTYTDFLYKPFERKTTAQIFREIDQVKKVSRDIMKKHGAEIGEQLGYKIEKQKLTGDVALDNIIKWMGKEHEEMLALERATGKKVGELSGYLRHYLTPEGRKFLAESKTAIAGLPKDLRARLKAAEPRKIAGTIKEINEYFNKTYGVKKFFEPDAFKAFALRKAEHIRYINTHNFLEATKRRFGVRMDRAISKYTPEGIELVESTAPELKGWLLPKPIVKHIDDTRKFLTNEEAMAGFIKAYDWLLSRWKVNVTGIWPAFHTRNFMGGSFNNWLAKVNPIDYVTTEKILRGSDEIIKSKIGVEYSGKQILDLAERYGVMGQPGMMDVYRGVDDAIKELTARNIKKVGIKASNAPRWMMEQVENRLRLPLFINRLKRGYSPAEAAKDVFKYHFDYVPRTGLTPFEQTYLRRIIPFYVWTRNNVPLQIEMMMKQPGKYASLEKIRQSAIDAYGKEEFKYLPDWMQEMFIAPLGMKDDIGRSLWVQLDLPLEDINKLPISSQGIREIASMLTPFLKYPIELYTNRNFYFGGDIVNPELPPEMQTREVIEQLKHLPNPIKKFLNFREVKYRDWRYPDEKRFITRYEMDARKLHFLNSFLGRYYSTLKGIFDEDIPPEWRVSRYVGGVPVRPIDIEEEKQRKEYEQERQAQEILRYLQQHNIIPYKTEEAKGRGLQKYLK